MSIYIGKKITIEIFGASHETKIGGKVHGIPKMKVDFEKLNCFMNRRKPNFSYSTTRREKDLPIFSGIKDGMVDGDFSFEIENSDVKEKDYKNLYGIPRPSHADYSSFLKDGNFDFKGGGRFSGRMTAPLCVVGGICKEYLESKGINICAYISQIGKIKGKSYKNNKISLEEFKSIKDFPSLSNKEKMQGQIEKVAKKGDSIGGIIECIVYGLKGGVGDNLFNGLEGKISSLIYSVPAVKGVEFGAGFNFSGKGSKLNDQMYFEDKTVKFYSNNNGGILGGISNGENITLSVAIKPTPSISIEQNSIDLIKRENVKIKIEGRHDACILPRAVPCIESAVAIAILDEIGENYE